MGRCVMKKMISYIRYIRSVRAGYRFKIFVFDVEVLLCQMWYRLHGEQFIPPIPPTEFGTCYLVTKYIPEIFFLEGVNIELVKLSCPGHSQSMKFFYSSRFLNDKCRDCGRSLKVTEEDRKYVEARRA